MHEAEVMLICAASRLGCRSRCGLGLVVQRILLEALHVPADDALDQRRQSLK